MTAANTPFSLEQLYNNVNGLLNKNLSVFEGLMVSNISVDGKIEPHPIYSRTYLKGTTKIEGKSDYSVTLKVPNTIIDAFLDQLEDREQNNTRLDITIKSLNINRYGMIEIIVSKIRETGMSDRELRKRELDRFCKKHGYYNRGKKEFPRLITKILALGSKFSAVHNDFLDNLNIPKENVKIIQCSSSKEIANNIINASPSSYEVVLMYRGGHEDHAMGMFSSEEIITAIADCPVPVCAALGHHIDEPFIYRIADKTFSSPTDFGNKVTEHNIRARDDLWESFANIKKNLSTVVDRVNHQNTLIIKSIESSSNRIYERASSLIDNSLKNILSTQNHIIDKKRIYVATMLQNVENRTAGIKKDKVQNIEKVEVGIDHSLKQIYQDALGRIDKMQASIGDHVKEISRNKLLLISKSEASIIKYTDAIIQEENHLRDKKAEKLKQRKQLAALSVVIAILAAVILFMLLS